MPYRANVKVIILVTDQTTGKPMPAERKDLAFSVLADVPRKARTAARAEFAKKHPDLKIKAINHTARDELILYATRKDKYGVTKFLKRKRATSYPRQ
jgi:hypothetical protein